MLVFIPAVAFADVAAVVVDAFGVVLAVFGVEAFVDVGADFFVDFVSVDVFEAGVAVAFMGEGVSDEDQIDQ